MEHPSLRRIPLRTLCSSCRLSLSQRTRSTASSIIRFTTSSRKSLATPSSNSQSTPSGLSAFSRNSFSRQAPSKTILETLDNLQQPRSKGGLLSYKPPPPPHHLHIYATRHNCHITLTSGVRDAIISVSSGNLNFRKAARGSYDAAFQLGAFVMAKIKNMGLLSERYEGKGGPIRALEIVFRDFGPGREAVTRILLGQEGREIKPKITRVMDSTRLKFGGTRSRKPRRLG